MKKFKFEVTDYLVVEVSDPISEKYIGFKCIPARWAENALRHNYLIIRYPEEESFETKLQVKTKEPLNPTWPLYCALIKFVTDSYEKACKVLDFLTEKDEMNLSTTSDKPQNTRLNNAELSEAPSTSYKRRSSDENEKVEDILPKKKRESAIRSENNVKTLIQSGQLLSNKQKVSPKKLLSLQKEVRTETLETLINAGQFDKIYKLFSKDVTEESHETFEIISSTDDNDTDSENDGEPETLRPPETTDSENDGEPETLRPPETTDKENDGEPETLRPPETSMLEAVLKNMPYPNNTPKTHDPALRSGKTPERSKNPLRETDTSQITSAKHLEQHKEPKTNTDGAQSSLNAEMSALGDFLRNQAPKNPGNGTKKDSAEDIKHLEDIYNSILGAKNNLNAIYMGKSEALRKAFRSINLFVPQLKQGLSLPSIQQLSENRQRTKEKPQPSSSRQEQPTQQ